MDAGAKFRQERAASAGRAIWEERRAKERIERDDEKEIAGAMKYHIVLGLVIIVILGFALFGTARGCLHAPASCMSRCSAAAD